MRCMWLVLLIAVPALAGCNQNYIVRDKATFEAETDLAEQMAVQSAGQLKEFLLITCKCDNGTWKTAACEKAADIVVTVETRAPYHKGMALYNAGISDVKPTKPTIPPAESLCPGTLTPPVN